MTPATIAEIVRRAEEHGGSVAADVGALLDLVRRLWPLASQAVAPTLDEAGRLMTGPDYAAAIDALPCALRASLIVSPLFPEALAIEPRCARCGGDATGLCEPCTRAVWGDVPCGEGAAPRRPR